MDQSGTGEGQQQQASSSRPSSIQTSPMQIQSHAQSTVPAAEPGDGSGSALLSPTAIRAPHRSWTGISGDIASYDPDFGNHPLAGPRSSSLISQQPGLQQQQTRQRGLSQLSAFSFELSAPEEDAFFSGLAGGTSSSRLTGTAGRTGDEIEDIATSPLGPPPGGGVLSSGPAGGSSSGAGGSGDGTSATVDPAVVRDMLDDSVWVESLRRSATMRRSGTRRSTRSRSGWGGSAWGS